MSKNLELLESRISSAKVARLEALEGSQENAPHNLIGGVGGRASSSSESSDPLVSFLPTEDLRSMSHSFLDCRWSKDVEDREIFVKRAYAILGHDSDKVNTAGKVDENEGVGSGMVPRPKEVKSVDTSNPDLDEDDVSDLHKKAYRDAAEEVRKMGCKPLPELTKIDEDMTSDAVLEEEGRAISVMKRLLQGRVKEFLDHDKVNGDEVDSGAFMDPATEESLADGWTKLLGGSDSLSESALDEEPNQDGGGGVVETEGLVKAATGALAKVPKWAVKLLEARECSDFPSCLAKLEGVYAAIEKTIHTMAKQGLN